MHRIRVCLQLFLWLLFLSLFLIIVEVVYGGVEMQDLLFDYLENEAMKNINRTTITMRRLDNKAFTRCSEVRDRYKVIIGQSWGDLTSHKDIQHEWEILDCNKLLSTINNRVKSQLELCQDLKLRYGIIPEVSWGSSVKRPAIRTKWLSNECNTVLKLKRNIDCDDIHGKKFVESWNETRFQVCERSGGQEEGYCKVSIRENVQCYFPQMVLSTRK